MRMSRGTVETVMGAVVLVVAALLLFFAYTTSQVSSITGNEYTARFEQVDGLHDGGDVRISGIKVGTIIGQELDPKTYLAIIHISIDPAIRLPTDSVATIASSGLLGDKFISIVPGGEDEMIKPGGEIEYTQPGFSLESLLPHLLSSGGQQTAGGKEGAGAEQKTHGQSAVPK
jgi:phospholipid/cholesterol/gamma-HCH transport system substrate-binding protein